MDTRGYFAEGQQPFEINPSDDYSARTITDRYASRLDIGKSFFLGTILRNCAFDSSNLNNVEFSESNIESCTFVNSDLSGSDFVKSNLTNVKFVHCTFDVGEWRESIFDNCSFEECTFKHTTVTLCSFRKCSWDSRSIASMLHRAVYFNTFSLVRVPQPLNDRLFVSRNFGIPASSQLAALVSFASNVTIEQLCLLNNLGQFSVISLAEVAYSVCDPLVAQVERRGSTLQFFAKVLSELAEERRISATSLMYIEDIISGIAYGLDENLADAALATLMGIHRSLVKIAYEDVSADDFGGQPTRVTFRFHGTYSYEMIDALRHAFAAAMDIDVTALIIDSVVPGSTFVQMALEAVGAVSTIMTAVNLTLRQATVAVEHVGRLKRAVKKNFGKPVPKASRRGPLAVKKPSTLATVVQPTSSVPVLARLRPEVRANGKVLTELDEPAHIKIVAEHVD